MISNSPHSTDLNLHALWQVLTLQAGYNTTLVILGVTLIGIASGLVGCFTLLRKRAMLSDALAHSALPGIAAAFLIATLLGYDGRSTPLLLGGAALSGVLGVLAVQALTTQGRIEEEAAIGVVLSVFFGFGILLLSAIQSIEDASSGGINRYIYGQTAALNSNDTIVLLTLAATILLITTLLFKEFALVCFDRGLAKQQGWPVEKLDLLLMFLVTLTVVIGLQSVGVLLVVALLIIPPTTARFWSQSLRANLILSAAFGGACGYLGAAASSLLPSLPAGAVIVLASGLLFTFSLLAAPNRGLIASALRLFNVRLTMVKVHLLRELGEGIEGLGSPEQAAIPSTTIKPKSIAQIRARSGISKTIFAITLRSCEKEGLLIRAGSELKLTQAGQARARLLAKKHKLWEEYLHTLAHLPESHLDLSADLAEHALTPELVAELEERLKQLDRSQPDLSQPDHSKTGAHATSSNKGGQQ